jgi:hypothetical protein
VRTALALIGGFVAAAVAWVGLSILLLVVGGTECDRGECNSIGEFADEHGAIVIVAFGLAAVLAWLVVARWIARRGGPRGRDH